MMAAVTAEQQKVNYTTSSKSDLLSISSDGEEAKSRSDASEQDYFDAQSHMSTQPPSEIHDMSDLGQDGIAGPDELTMQDEETGQEGETDDRTGPKIVETVAKKHVEGEVEVEHEPEPVPENAFSGIVKPLNKVLSESVIEREIRLQKEREEALMREREEALKRASSVGNATSVQQSPKPIPLPVIYSAPNYYVQTGPHDVSPAATSPIIISAFNPAETRIALELREMREREEELRKLRQQTLSGSDDFDVQATIAVDDGFSSIPNIDEGNYSENGSEEKELVDGEDTRQVASPEVPVQGEFAHHRTQSVDSTSSGHSSGSGGVPEGVVVRRRVVVKPFEDVQSEEVPAYMRKQKETPIEREIRLAREREEELRREKGLQNANGPVTAPSLSRPEVTRVKSASKLISNDPRSVQHRLATSRIQHEIDEAAERESELRKAGTIQTTSEETLDSKVTRFTELMEYSIEEQDRKMHMSSMSSSPSATVISPVADQTDNADVLSSSTLDKPAHAVSPPQQSSNSTARLNLTSPVTPKRYSVPLAQKGQRGLMERFLASRGKLGLNATSNPVALSNSFGIHVNASFQKPPVLMPEDFQVSDEVDPSENERNETSRLAIRPKYTPAEEKIQNELKDMRRREEELRLQRARIFASSQPNLLTIMDDEEDETHRGSLDDTHVLRASQSNPNLLDSTDTKTGEESEISPEEKNFLLGSRKRSPLIAQWESRIQQATDH